MLPLTLMLLAPPASSCVMPDGPAPKLAIDDTITDDDMPQAPEVVDIRITRGSNPKDSCGMYGEITIDLELQGDDPDGEVGYLLDARGELPTNFDFEWRDCTGVEVWPDYDGSPCILDDRLWFYWTDGANAEQEAFDFTLELTPVDLAGNWGEPLPIEVAHPGTEPLGCNVVPTGPAGVWCLVLAVAASQRRRRYGHI